MTADRPTLSVVAPVFNEEAILHELYRRLSQVLDGAALSWELVLINDGSRDRSPQIMRELHDQDPRVKVLDFARNFGHQIAITAGHDFASGDTVTTIDADLQDPPELISELIAAWRRGADIVYAVRIERKGETAFKKGAASLFYRMMRRLADVDMPVDVGDFRLLSRRAVDALQSMPEHHRYVRGMVAWLGFPSASVSYSRDPRLTGETKYPLGKMVRFALDGVLAFSNRPLRIATWLGIVTSVAAFLAAIVLVVGRLTGAIPVVQGWTSLAVILLFFSGVQLMTIGALGEYTGRIYTEVRGRPLYLVSETLGHPAD